MSIPDTDGSDALRNRARVRKRAANSQATSLKDVKLQPHDADVLQRLAAKIGTPIDRGPRGATWMHIGTDDVPVFVFGNSESYTYGTNADGHIVQLNIQPTTYPADRAQRPLQLDTFPDEILELEHLRYLDIRNNIISRIPPSIFARPWVLTPDGHPPTGRNHQSVLAWKGNPVEQPPPEILRRGSGAIQDWLTSISEGTQCLNEVKILLIGDGFAGKTSLQKQLIGGMFDASEPQTHGINIRMLRTEGSRGAVTARMWDFGGQEIMHATHQFFLSKRSIYLVVLDGRREDHTEYWLKTVAAFGGDSPICVVINKIDENPAFDVNRAFLKAKYPSIIGFARISCKTGHGISELRELIKQAIEMTNIVSVPWPPSWLAAKTAIESTEKHYLDFEDYKMICEVAGVSEYETQETLRDFLNDLGVVLHFEDIELEGVYVLDPAWVTGGVYKIINSTQLAQSSGILAVESLRHIFKNDSAYPPGKRRYILELMKRFELCFNLNATTALIPDLLSIQQPSLPVMSVDAIQINIRFSFLPRSLLPRFIVRMHQRISQQLLWRSGVVVVDEILDAMAIVTSDIEQSTISAIVDGARRREYLTVILAAIRAISSSYEGIQYGEKIPLESNGKIEISYEHLLRLEAMGEEEYLVDGMTEPVMISRLLGTVSLSPRTKREAEDLLMIILERLEQLGDGRKGLVANANSVVMLQPNFMGLGVDINKIVAAILNKKKNEKR